MCSLEKRVVSCFEERYIIGFKAIPICRNMLINSQLKTHCLPTHHMCFCLLQANISVFLMADRSVFLVFDSMYKFPFHHVNHSKEHVLFISDINIRE